LHAIGDPQEDFASILVAGSNGKGSTAAMLDQVLSAHGVATGLYTSPHLVQVEERVQIRGQAIARPELDRHLTTLDAFPDLTFFETLTAAAFMAFADAAVECAILEAGMGGRWDATRLADSAIVGLTNIGTDHARWLGDDRVAIAGDKGEALAAATLGVLGPGVDATILPHVGAPDAIPAAQLIELEPFHGGTTTARWNGQRLSLDLPLAGRHQVDNLHLALALARAAETSGLVSDLRPAAILDGLDTVHWPGRLSRHRILGRDVLLDGAHNLEAAQALAAHLAGDPVRYSLLFSCLDDKPVKAMAGHLEPWVGQIAVCTLDDPRAMPIGRLAAAFQDAHATDSPVTALELLPEPILAAGSLRLVGALLAQAGPS